MIETPLPDSAAPLLAGAGKADITNRDAGPVNDPLFAKALVLKEGATSVVFITVDAVAIGEIGHIRNDYLPTVRSCLETELGIPPGNVVVNASHCHGIVCKDVAERTVEAVREAAANLVPVRVGASRGREDRIMENRRLQLKNGREADVRHAYALPPDHEVSEVGPIDPEIGLLRLDREDGRPLAAIYNFACHPIQGVPSGANTADITGFASELIETGLGDNAIVLFLQGCAGDINPAHYKDVHAARDAEPLGHKLGLSALRALKGIRTCVDGRLKIVRETLQLPRRNLAARIAELEKAQERLFQSLRGTSLNLKSFISLFLKYGLFGQFPSDDSHAYLHEEALNRKDLATLDEVNRRHVEQYLNNISVMEELTRVRTNLALLRKHQATNEAASAPFLEVEVVGIRVGDFVLLTFPGELSVQIGLNIKETSPHDFTFVAPYTNGYIYYSPTAKQLENPGWAQEDCDCLLAPEWQARFEEKATEILGRL